MTAFGRMMIEQSQQLVESKYRIANGYAHDAKVHVGQGKGYQVSQIVNNKETMQYLFDAESSCSFGDST